MASLNRQMARREQSPCPGDQQLVIASIVAQPLEPCKCHIFPVRAPRAGQLSATRRRPRAILSAPPPSPPPPTRLAVGLASLPPSPFPHTRAATSHGPLRVRAQDGLFEPTMCFKELVDDNKGGGGPKPLVCYPPEAAYPVKDGARFAGSLPRGP